MRPLAFTAALALAGTAHAVDWKPLPAPATYQSMIDLDAVKTQKGMTQFTVRRLFARPQAHASGKDFHSLRVTYLGDCAAQTATRVLAQYYDANRKLIEANVRKTVRRSELTAPEAGSDVAAALRMACAHAAATPGGSKPPAQSSSGTGIVVTSEGHVLTNAHVVRQCDALELIDDLNARYRATVKATDPARDLALLSAESRAGDVAIFRRESAPKLGEPVTIVGYPLVAVLGTRPTVGFGNVASTVGVRGDPAQMQISVPVQRGASGGPVLDEYGHVIGVVVSKLDALRLAPKLGDLAQNVNFAVRGDTVRAFLEAQHVQFRVANNAAKLENTELAKRGAAVTVRVRCLREGAPPNGASAPQRPN